MSARLPTPGGDSGDWGNVLNTFLAVEHNADGTHDISSIPQSTVTNLVSDLAAKVDDGALVFNVKDYGAKGDAKRLRTVTASTASATVTAANGSFVSGDVGKLVVVYTEDAAGTITTIASVQSTTQITLAAAAGITVSGSNGYLVYGTDDSSAIAAAITAATHSVVDTSTGPNQPMGVGMSRVLLPAQTADGGYIVRNKITVAGGVVLDSPGMLFNMLADRFDPVVQLNPYAACESLIIEALFGAGIRAGSGSTAQAHIRMGNIRLWHIGYATESGGAQRSQNGLELAGYHFEVMSFFVKGGVRAIYHNQGGDAIINYAYAIGSFIGVQIVGGNQIAYSKLFLDTCGATGGGYSGVVIDNFASNIDMDIQAFEVTGTTHILDNVVALGANSVNTNKDISLKIQANNTGGVVLAMAHTQELSAYILGSNSTFPSGATLPITTAVVYGTGNTGINAITAMLETSITPFTGTLQGTYQYSQLDKQTFSTPVTVTGEVTAINTPSTDIYNGNALAVGEELLPRLNVNGSQSLNASGSLHLTYFTARKTETINNVQMVTDSTAATGVTLARMGVYSVDPGTGNLTLVAATANDVNLFNGAYSAFQRALTTPFNKVKGTRYAFAVLVVGTGMPNLSAIITPAGIDASAAPRLNGLVTGQADLPATIAAGVPAGDYRIFQATMTP